MVVGWGKGVCTCPGLVAWLLKECVFEQGKPWAWSQRSGCNSVPMSSYVELDSNSVHLTDLAHTNHSGTAFSPFSLRPAHELPGPCCL